MNKRAKVYESQITAKKQEPFVTQFLRTIVEIRGIVVSIMAIIGHPNPRIHGALPEIQELISE